MKNSVQSQTEKLNKAHQKKRRWQKVVTAMAAVVVFCTTYALILPALTWERQLLCEQEEHQHTDECYETVMVPPVVELSCTMEEHIHDDDCYEVQRRLVCPLEECDGHAHGEGCYDEGGSLICELEETESHVHTEECWTEETVLICGLEEHTHSDRECYTVTEEHEERVPVCGIEEHIHGDACYDAPPKEDDGYACGSIEHTHNEHCYFSDGSLRCTIPEHTHTEDCLSDKTADVETAKEWKKSFEDGRSPAYGIRMR